MDDVGTQRCERGLAHYLGGGSASVIDQVFGDHRQRNMPYMNILARHMSGELLANRLNGVNKCTIQRNMYLVAATTTDNGFCQRKGVAPNAAITALRLRALQVHQYLHCRPSWRSSSTNIW